MNKQTIRRFSNALAQPAKKPSGIGAVEEAVSQYAPETLLPEKGTLMGGNTKLSAKSLKGRALKEGRPTNLRHKQEFASGPVCGRE